MYRVGDWVVEKETGRIGILKNKTWCEVSIRFGQAVALRHPDQIELAPLDIHSVDILAMQHLAVDIGDRDWFMRLGERLESEMKS
ncbi:hypothetical protein J1P26_20010 [Neobacillus sp. MM2021_6]|uniref:hypothetical protein n=1 Tax=Bacillaceae TaxID=186817 RepID=UPI00140BA0EF|nr:MULTISPECIES: hypothetical protein [Bacillaceae]MBO0961994.1 hypothetical protein [Neobacillus sp. MM2021_6]NHC20310.1 hypothetical protein [Bacillus sp. MM2020_4]